MARIDDGELYLEIEGATEEQLRAGLSAARRHLVSCGVDVARAMRAEARRDEHLQKVLLWEAGKCDHPDDEFTATDCELADIAEEAWQVAIEAAGADNARLGLIDVTERDGHQQWFAISSRRGRSGCRDAPGCSSSMPAFSWPSR